MKKNKLSISKKTVFHPYLFIFRKSSEESSLVLWDGKNRFTKKIKETVGVRKNVLKEIDSFLRAHKVIPSHLLGVVVYSGPGQFSFLRTSISIANTFGYALKIPVVGVEEKEYTKEKDFFSVGLEKIQKTKIFCPVVPAYGKEPNISQPKKKSF